MEDNSPTSVQSEEISILKESCPIDVIEVKSGLQIDFDKSESIKTTIRVDKDVWYNFSSLYKEK